MGHTVKPVAEIYDETGLLKPARVGANGHRIYEEPRLLTLQQILFHRELGFELKAIGEILGRADFEKHRGCSNRSSRGRGPGSRPSTTRSNI